MCVLNTLHDVSSVTQLAISKFIQLDKLGNNCSYDKGTYKYLLTQHDDVISVNK